MYVCIDCPKERILSHLCIHIYIHTYMHTYSRVYIQPRAVQGRALSPMHTYIHTYIHAYIHTAVILENFHELSKGEHSVVPVKKLNEFVDIWTEFDPNADQEIGDVCICVCVCVCVSFCICMSACMNMWMYGRNSTQMLIRR